MLRDRTDVLFMENLMEATDPDDDEGIDGVGVCGT